MSTPLLTFYKHTIKQDESIERTLEQKKRLNILNLLTNMSKDIVNTMLITKKDVDDMLKSNEKEYVQNKKIDTYLKYEILKKQQEIKERQKKYIEEQENLIKIRKMFKDSYKWYNKRTGIMYVLELVYEVIYSEEEDEYRKKINILTSFDEIKLMKIRDDFYEFAQKNKVNKKVIGMYNSYISTLTKEQICDFLKIYTNTYFYSKLEWVPEFEDIISSCYYMRISNVEII